MFRTTDRSQKVLTVDNLVWRCLGLGSLRRSMAVGRVEVESRHDAATDSFMVMSDRYGDYYVDGLSAGCCDEESRD
jgi:hypothetical protein